MGYYVEDPAHAISYIEEAITEISDEDEAKFLTNSIRNIEDDLTDLKNYFNNKQGE